jgi:protein-tyrosine phosphatase
MEGLAWLSRRQRDGGVDRVELPADVPGELWLCGKHAIGPDHRKLIDEVGGGATVVCLVERHELADRYPQYVAWLDDSDDAEAVWYPIPDLHAPTLEAMLRLVDRIVGDLVNGRRIVVHCAAGIGRTGTTAVCVLIGLGLDIADAESRVAEARPGAGPEVGTQRTLVTAVSAHAFRRRSGSQRP